MARGRGSRGGRSGRQQGGRGGNRGGQGRQGRGRQQVGRGGAGAETLPTAAPGSANAPVGASVFGAQTATAPSGPMVARPAARPRGGPRQSAGEQGMSRRDRRTRAAAAMHDFHYVPRDLRWIAITSGVSAALVLALWAGLG